MRSFALRAWGLECQEDSETIGFRAFGLGV